MTDRSSVVEHAQDNDAADVIVVGAGIAGLTAACELLDAGRSVIVLDQEPQATFGGQAFWSFGGLFLVNSPEQRRLGIHDSEELALADWLGSAEFDRPEDYWPREWAKAYVHFAAGEKRRWLHSLGLRWFPVVQWAERGGYAAGYGTGNLGAGNLSTEAAAGHGNSVPRFHVTWGTGPAVIAPFVARLREAEREGRVRLLFRHRVTSISLTNGVVDGVDGEILQPSAVGRSQASSRAVIGEFSLRADAVIVTSGGIGANHEQIRRNWPASWGAPPQHMVSGVPDHVDGLMQLVTEAAGGRVINPDRMWHYPEGVQNFDPVWSRHGIRILSGPSPLWLDSQGQRLPPPLFPGFDALGALRHITAGGHAHSWFVLDEKTIATEFALSGSEQNLDLTDKNIKAVLARRRHGPDPALAAFLDRGVDFLIANTVPELAAKMNALTGANLIDAEHLHATIHARDLQVRSGLGKDPQLIATAAARRYIGDRLVRIVTPHELLDGSGGRLVAVRLHVLTRKTLGGIETDLQARVLAPDGRPVPGLFAAGEVAGFGGGGMHGYRALEGTFLGGALFSGRVAGRAAGQRRTEAPHE